MKQPERHWLVRVALATAVSLSLFATPAYAQPQDEKPKFREPNISFLDPQRQYVQWIAGTLMIAAVLLIAFKNPHRSHLD